MANELSAQAGGGGVVLMPGRPARSLLGTMGHSLWRDRSGIIGLTLCALVLFCAICAPWVSPHDPFDQHLDIAKQPPAWSAGGTWSYPLGTDNLGRDLLSRIIYGSRVSLVVGFCGVLIASSIGLVVGMLSGFIGGSLDAVVMGIVNVLLGFPYLLFVVVVASIFGRSLVNVILIFGITCSPLFARMTRGDILVVREYCYVEAAREHRRAASPYHAQARPAERARIADHSGHIPDVGHDLL